MPRCHLLWKAVTWRCFYLVFTFGVYIEVSGYGRNEVYMRILVVEDEAGIAKMLRQGLEEASYLVDVAADGTVGLEMATTPTYHLIVLDVMLPGRHGWSLCES